MLKSPSRILPLFILVVCCYTSACKKSHSSAIQSSLSFTATSVDSGSHAVYFSNVVVAVQEVDTLHSTLISGQYSDTSSLLGSLSIRLIGDTTGTFKGNNLLVTYVDGQGNIYNSQGDSTDFVTITQFSKLQGGTVRGSFYLTVSGTPGTLTLTGGQFVAGFLD